MPKRDEIQEEGEPPKKREKTDKNWNDMSNEIKVMIINNMDFITKTRLKMCSKADKCLVEAFPMVVTEIRANLRSEWQRSEKVVFDDHKFSADQHALRLWCLNDRVTVTKYEEEEKTRRFISKESAFELFESYFYKILTTENLRVENFSTNWVLKDSCIPADHMFHFDSVDIGCEESKECIKWLKYIAPGVKEITTGWECYVEKVGDISCVLSAQYIHLYKTDINNEQLINFKATQLYLGMSMVTVDGIKKLVKKWINEDYPIGSNFNISFLSIPTPTIDQFIDGEYDEVETHGSTSKIMVQTGSNKVMCIELKKPNFDRSYTVKGNILNKT